MCTLLAALASAKIRRYDERQRIVAVIAARWTINAGTLRCAIAIAAVEDFAFEQPDWFAHAMRLYVGDKLVEFGDGERIWCGRRRDAGHGRASSRRARAALCGSVHRRRAVRRLRDRAGRCAGEDAAAGASTAGGSAGAGAGSEIALSGGRSKRGMSNCARRRAFEEVQTSPTLVASIRPPSNK